MSSQSSDEDSAPEESNLQPMKKNEEEQGQDTASTVVTTSASSTKKDDRKKAAKKAKSQRKADLRKRTMGVGLGKIDIDAPKRNKIRFDNDDEEKQHENDDTAVQGEDQVVGDAANATDSDDDDGPVEQVSSSAAKQKIMELRAAERKTRQEEKEMVQKKKRKRKEAPPSSSKTQPKEDESSEDDDDDLDDDFLAMVDSERKNDLKLQKLKKKKENEPKLNRHTTFVSEGDDILDPQQKEHNIELIVLPSAQADEGVDGDGISINKQALGLSSSLGTKPSDVAQKLCKGNLLSKKNDDIDWKRSRKLKYRLRKGKPALNFLVKKQARVS